MTIKQLSDVKEKVEQAAHAIATLPPTQWPGWVTYLLEALDDELSKADWRAAEYSRDASWRLLDAVKASIEIRLDAGRW